MKPSGVITITTDFGHQGPFVGVMKGVILRRLISAHIIDLTHEIVVHWPAEAGFWLARAFSYFPSGTVHIAVVDPGVGTSRDIIVVTAGGHWFLAPDNGLLAPIVGRHSDATVVRLTAQRLTPFGIHSPSATFHGRDIFAPIAAELAAGRCVPTDLGERQRVHGWLFIVVAAGLGSLAVIRATVTVVLKHHPARLVVALPAGTVNTCRELGKTANGVICPVFFWTVSICWTVVCRSR